MSSEMVFQEESDLESQGGDSECGEAEEPGAGFLEEDRGQARSCSRPHKTLQQQQLLILQVET